MKTLLTSIVSWAAIAIVAALMLGYSGGCQSNAGNPDVQQVAVDAAQTVAVLQTNVDRAQAAVDALNARLATLPANDPLRKDLEKQLSQVQPLLTRAKIVLELAQLGTDVFAQVAVAPPATQPAK